MIYLFSADSNGTDSIQDIIEANTDKLTVFEVNSYEAFENNVRAIVPKIQKGDIVILDTISMLAANTRGDLKVGTNVADSLWEKRDKFMADAQNRNAYDAASNLIMRRLKDLKNLGARIIVTAHESEREDNTGPFPTKKRSPDVNAALLSNLEGSASDMVRLRVVFEDMITPEGKVKFKKGQRLIDLAPSDEYRSKVHVPLAMAGKVPSIITRPSITKLEKVLGKKSSWLVAYGPPGTGKSTFALSMLIDPNGEGIGL